MSFRWLVTGLAAVTTVRGITLDVNDDQSIKDAASIAAYKLVSLYPGNTTTGIPGLLGSPYYWWEAGAMFGALVDYWYYTGDTSYNNITTQALAFQIGDDQNYEPSNQTSSLGNDDQAFWAVAALRAAEVNYPDPPEGTPSWIALAQAVFNRQAARWDTQYCAGGLRWQIFTLNNGYNYKNSISNGMFFNLAARLYAYTGNETYAEWATKTWEWTLDIGLMTDYNIYDGASTTTNCSTDSFDLIQWSYNAGVYMYGAAAMWNMTTDGNTTVADVWMNRTQSLWTRTTEVFFTGDAKNIMYEVACEEGGNCNVDQLSFKGFLSRWAAVTTQVAPFMSDAIRPYLEASAAAAAQNCVGGDDGTTCGTKWYESGYDGTTGVGQQMVALETFQSLLANSSAGPLSVRTGATSEQDPTAGSSSDSTSDIDEALARPITKGDIAGASILTILLAVGTVALGWFMVFHVDK